MEDLALSPEMDGAYDSSADEFYEQIEAPKFVDLTVRDPVRVDDRYWFCSRVGCDQKHEEELDSEEVYKNFVLRIMAARSPNVRLQKALSRRQAPIKCPQSAPPKSARPRASRLALISTSITKKLADFKAKGSEAISTPAAKEKAKAKKSSVVAAKYMTTPRNRNCVPKVDSFRSVQNSKEACAGAVKSKVAKALVFHSPKKPVKLKASLELKTPVRRVCERLKKLEADEASQKRRILGYSPKSPKSTSASKPKVSRPWRVSGKKKCAEERQEGRDGKKVGTLDSKKRKGCEKFKTAENGANDLPLKESGQLEEMTAAECVEEPMSPIKGSEEDDTRPENARRIVDPLVNPNADENQVSENLVESEKKEEVPQEAKSSDENQVSENLGESEKKEEVPQEAKSSDENLVSENLGELEKKEEVPQAAKSSDENQISENVSESEKNEKEQEESGSTPHDNDKENESAPDPNRTRRRPGQKVPDSEETCKKILKMKSKATVKDGAQVLQKHYSKPKPTNPKPFRLRTDERGVLKEAQSEKKIRSALQIGKCNGDIIQDTKPDPKKIRNPRPKVVKEAQEKPGDPTSAKKPEKPKSILSSGKRKNVTPGRDCTTKKPTVSFLIPGEKTPERIKDSEKVNKAPSGKSPSGERRSLTPTGRKTSSPSVQKPKNSARRLP